jgi:hypothetical protein
MTTRCLNAVNDIDSLTDVWKFFTPGLRWLSDLTCPGCCAIYVERINREVGYKPGLVLMIDPPPAHRIMVRVLLAASLAALPTLASAQILSPVNGNNYTIFNAHNNRCALLIGPFTNNYVPVVMGSCTGGTNELVRFPSPFIMISSSSSRY